MSDDIEDRVRRAMRSAVPPAPAHPGYGERLDRFGRQRRARAWLAVGVVSVVAVLGVVSGVTLAADPVPDASDGPSVAADTPAAPEVPAVSCDTPVGPGTALPETAVVEVRLCDGVAGRQTASREVLAPADSLVGVAAQEFVARVDAFDMLTTNVDLDCSTSGADFRFVLVAADGTTGQVLQDGSSCDMVTVDGEQRIRRGIPTYLELLHLQRARGATLTAVAAHCPDRLGVTDSTVGVDIPAPEDEGVTVLLCRYPVAGNAPDLVRELEVVEPAARTEVLELLADGVTGHDPCNDQVVGGPLANDIVVVVDAWGDVLSASTFRCFAYPRPGSWDDTGTSYGGGSLWWPAPQLSETVAELLDR
ncbi:MAG: hypothetical protein M3419_06520 [Actinomycetota bacterium]|nr:hypothetical protein [Actinomycetota bacterium]MDQ3628445.1 hypothetical protein [Actinomycetota bacterium]